MASEKTQQNLIHGIEGFDATKLKHADTQEKNPLPDKDGTVIYNTWQIDAIPEFLKLFVFSLKFTLFFSLSFQIAIDQEKEKINFINNIENFDATKLKHTETMEKNPLPTKEIIEEEKQTA